jgi:arginine/lysine/ornithine decarboxylase
VGRRLTATAGGKLSMMNQNSTPFLDAVEQIRREGTYTFSLPGHRFGLGIDDRTPMTLPP